MKKKNVIFITPTGSKVVIATQVYCACFSGANGATSYYYVSEANWEKFKSQSSYTDNEIAHCLCSQMVPGQFELINGTFLIEIC